MEHNNDAPPKSGHTVFSKILAWSKNKQLWQRDALRRVVLHGYPDHESLDEILNLCLKEHGYLDSALEPDPLSEKHLPSDSSSDETVSLHSISEVVGVNRLDSGQTLTFGSEGLTIIYGRNGTGKSGYTRILKKACQSRHVDNILPDVYSSETLENATATLQITKPNGSKMPVSWQDNTDPEKMLLTITVFDRAAASIHVRQENEVWFRPFGLDIPDDLSNIYKKIRERLSAKEEALEKQKDPIFSDPIWSPESKLGRMLSDLKADTDVDSIESSISFSREDESRLNQIKLDLAKHPSVIAQEQRRYSEKLNKLIGHLQKIESLLSEEAIQKTINIKNSADEARAAANAAAEEAFSELSLKRIGEPIWLKLWESARAYSQIAYESDAKFPPSKGDVCVLCHQEISETAANQMLGFEEFVKQDTESKAANAEKTFQEAKKALQETIINLKDISEIYKELKEKKHSLSRDISRYFAAAKILRCQVLTLLDNEHVQQMIELPPSLIENLNIESKQALLRANEIEGPENQRIRKNLEQEQHNLEDLKQSERLIQIAKTEVQRLQKIKCIKSCISSTNTQTITRLGNEIADEVITPKMDQSFEKEISELSGGLNVKVVRSSGKSGIPQYRVILDTDSQSKVNVQEVLSEGEQTCVALASYLTELANASHKSSLIFDDPVSSLDHKFRYKVAQRLVEEAHERQIIVFTHDMVFVDALLKSAEVRKTEVHCSYLTRRRNAVGIVNDKLPWEAAKLNLRFDELEKMARKAKEVFNENNDEAYGKEAARVYSLLRATLERVLEDIVFAGTIMRQREYIRIRDIHKITALEEGDLENLKLLYKKCSDLSDAHDSSRGYDQEPPDPDEMLNDIADLKSWSTALRKKMDGIASKES